MTCTYLPIPVKEKHDDFMRKSVEIIFKHVFEGTKKDAKVCHFIHPKELFQTMDLELKWCPSTHESMLKAVEDILKYSHKTGNIFFLNQIFACVDPYGLIGGFLTDAINVSVFTYEVSPVVIVMEDVILRDMRKAVGWPDGKGDGMFSPGGSMSNGYGVNLARCFHCPDLWKKGVSTYPRLVSFVSEDAHYSTKKFSAFQGMGADNVYSIKTDEKGIMIVSDLIENIERALKEGAKPFLVVATAGTTVLGAFDPINEIADVCEKYKLWLHVDGAWGGGVLMSRKHRSKMAGVERADSLTWNPHKMLVVPQQCSVFLTKHEGLLAETHSLKAAYLFQPDKFYDTSYDTGDKHVQCGRRADVLKFWFMWKAKGWSGFEKHVDKIFENADYFISKIKDRPDFDMVVKEPQCTNICFFYLPPNIRKMDKNDPTYKEKLHKVAPKMKERMMMAGTMMIAYQAVRGLPNFWRVLFQNSAMDKPDIDLLINRFEEFGKDL